MHIKEIKIEKTSNGKVFQQYQLAVTFNIGKILKNNFILYHSYHKLLESKQKDDIIDKKIFKVNQEFIEIFSALKLISMPFVPRKFVVFH